MRQHWWGLIAVMGAASVADAHPGGTDRYGCHVERATGVRHCHGEGGTGETDVNSAAELALEVGTGALVLGDYMTFHASYHLQHDATMLFLAGFGGEKHHPFARVGGFFDLKLGAALLSRSELTLAMKALAGAKFLVGGNWRARQAYLKLGVFLDAIVIEEEGSVSVGLSLTLGAAL